MKGAKNEEQETIYCGFQGESGSVDAERRADGG
jgi:hypothetical protein